MRAALRILLPRAEGGVGPLVVGCRGRCAAIGSHT